MCRVFKESTSVFFDKSFIFAINRTKFMAVFFEETSIRWSDLDANRHLANASYMNFTSFARISLMRKAGIDMSKMADYDIGPAVLREEFSFFKEAHEGEKIIITAAQTGASEKGEIFTFEHNLYRKKDGVHLCNSKLIGVWFSMSLRKITPPPAEMLNAILGMTDKSKLKTLTYQDLKNLPEKSQNVDPKIFQ